MIFLSDFDGWREKKRKMDWRGREGKGRTERWLTIWRMQEIDWEIDMKEIRCRKAFSEVSFADRCDAERRNTKKTPVRSLIKSDCRLEWPAF
jgi:hypothetical protein